MNWPRSQWIGVVGALLLAAVTGASGAAASPEPFDVETWPRLHAQLPRPAAVVFAATTCAVCPRVVSSLQQSVLARGVAAPIVAVVMDGSAADVSATHWKGVDRVFWVDADEAAVRYRVDPAWRGVLPYVALLDATGGVTRVAGQPSASQVEAWLAVGVVVKTKRLP